MLGNRRPQTLVAIETALHRTGSVLVDFGYAATPEDHQAGRIKWLRLAMTAKQAREVGDALRDAAGVSRQSSEPGHA